ncbi:MAG: peptide-methionine (R)-S-oxide reductase, partial [Acidobacteria bacterium]|nr:peptide-methionine (R)-S-oxide reductase [Acidobacteriota bacterium]
MKDEKIAKLEKSKKEWRGLLDPDAYRVLFEESTERAFTSLLLKEKRKGTYICAACYLPLFEAETKFESGTGWPSFFKPIAGHLGTKRDFKLLLPRTEYHCIRCGG